VADDLLVDAAAGALSRAIRLGVAVVAGSPGQLHGLRDVEHADAVVVHTEIVSVEPWRSRESGKPRQAGFVQRDRARAQPRERNADVERLQFLELGLVERSTMSRAGQPRD
jgi:hypothetical protein